MTLTIDPKELLASPEMLERIEFVCRRRFALETDADGCYLFILEKLQDNDFARLRSFSGRSTLKTFTYTLLNNLATDYKRSRYGRRRIPKAISDIGEWAMAVYRYVCWQKFSYEDAFEMVVLDGLYEQEFSAFLLDSKPIREAPCAERPQFVSTDDDHGPDLADDQQNNPLAIIMARMDQDKRLRAARIIRTVTVALDEEEQLLIRLVYGDGISIAAAARTLGRPASTVNRRLKKLLLLYREKLLAEGIRQ